MAQACQGCAAAEAPPICYRPAVSILSRLPLHPLLLAAFAVLSVYASNLTEVLPVDLGGPSGPLAWAILAAGAALLVCSLAMRDWRRGAILATAAVAAYAFFGRLAPELLGLGLSEQLQVAAWAVVVVAAGVFAVRVRGALPSATLALNAFTLLLVAMTLFSIVPYESHRVAAQGHTSPDAGTPITSTKVPDRDIYLIVLDSYGSHWSIEHRFGIADDELPTWLARQGFQVVPGARTNYRATDFSLASMFSMQMLDEYSVDPGRDSGDRTAAISRLLRPADAAFLKANGYTYYHLGSWWGPTQTDELADVNLSWQHDTEFESVLRQSTMLPAIDRLLGNTGGEGDEFRDGARATAEFQFRQLQRLPSVPGRKFVFAHILLPHPPYVFDAKGGIVIKATAQTEPEAQLYANLLQYTDSQVEQAVSALLAGPSESDPIIIIVGDEGPLLCRNVDCNDGSVRRLGIRFGVLAAFYLPDQPAGFFPPDLSLVNTFRMLFSSYFGADLPSLPNRSYDWPDNEHIYDFHDITDQLPLPGSPDHPDGVEMPPMDEIEHRAVTRPGLQPDRVICHRGRRWGRRVDGLRAAGRSYVIPPWTATSMGRRRGL